MAIFSQTSTTGAVIGLFLLILSSLPYLYREYSIKQITWSKTQVWYLFFISVCIISTMINIADYKNDWGNIGKMRYFVFALILSFAFRHLYKNNFFTEKRIKVLAYTLMSSLTIVTITSIIGMFVHYNFWKRMPSPQQRLEGVVSIGNYGQELPVITLFFLAVLINYKKIPFVMNRVFLIVCLLINVYAVYISGMRSALYGFLIAMPFLFYFHGKRNFFKAIMASLLLVGFVVGATFYLKFESRQFMNVDNASNNMRLSMWKKSIEAFQEKPIFGHGYLSRNNKYLAADSVGKETVPLHIAHSSYFQMLKDTGLIGTIAFLGFLFLWFRNLSTKDNIISRLCLASLICSYFHGIPHNFLINGSNSGMLLAVLYAMSEIHFQKSNQV